MGPETVSAKKEKPRVTIYLHIPKDHHLYKGFDMSGIKVGKNHRMGLDGEVNSISEDDYGKSLGLEVTGMDGVQDQSETIGEQMKMAKEGRKIKKFKQDKNESGFRKLGSKQADEEE